MAKDMLDAIRAAEENALLKEDEAKRQAAQTIAGAKKQGEQLVAERLKKAESDEAALINAAIAENNKLADAARAEAESACDEISRLAQKNRAAVIKKAADALLG